MGWVEGKKVLVTAAGQGIGRSVAIGFANAGANVIAADINEETLSLLANEQGMEVRKLDVLDRTAIAACSKELGAIDLLFNGAGFVHAGNVLEMTDEEYDYAMNLNVRSMVHMTQAFLPGMVDKGEGVIINMSSVASSIKGVPNRFIYTTTKAAVIGLTKSIAADFIKQGIRCNAICPGTVESPSLEGRMRAQGDYEAARQDFIARQPMGRIGQPEEIADLAIYLANATFTTGQAVVIDGGWAI